MSSESLYETGPVPVVTGEGAEEVVMVEVPICSNLTNGKKPIVSPVVPPSWILHGSLMVLAWSSHGSLIVLSLFFHGSRMIPTMVLSWFSHSFPAFPPSWFPHCTWCERSDFCGTNVIRVSAATCILFVLEVEQVLMDQDCSH